MYELTLYFIPSPYGIDWTSPKTLVKSAIRSHLTLMNRNIGHVWIEIKREDSGGKRHLITGMRGVKMGNPKLILLKGHALGVLFNNYDGRLEKTQEILNEMPKQIKNNRLNYVKFKISKETCLRVEKYFDEYVSKNYGKHYGLPNQPLRGDGSGCSAFGASFLKVAGILDDEFKNGWTYDLKMPLEFIGGPSNNNQKVSIFDIIRSDKTARWSNENEPHKQIFFWDPDRMNRWLLRKYGEHSAASNYEAEMKDGMHGVVYDKVNVPTPTEPIWQSKI